MRALTKVLLLSIVKFQFLRKNIEFPFKTWDPMGMKISKFYSYSYDLFQPNFF